MGRFIDISGRRFGHLIVIRRVDDHILKGGRKQAMWECVCDCGKTSIASGDHLRSGHTTSCGCRQMEAARKAQRKYNPYRIEGEKAFVKFFNCDKEMIVDLDFWENDAKRFCWTYSGNGYAKACIGDRRSIEYYHIYAFPNCPEGMVRDHIDGNKLNNTRENIRFVRPIDNAKNHSAIGRGASGRTGVSRKRGKWCATIVSDRRIIDLGTFDDIADAIKARKAAEIKYFGEFRRIE